MSSIEYFGYTSDGWLIINHSDNKATKVIILRSWGSAAYKLACDLQSHGLKPDKLLTKRSLIKYYVLLALLIIVMLFLLIQWGNPGMMSGQ